MEEKVKAGYPCKVKGCEGEMIRVVNHFSDGSGGVQAIPTQDFKCCICYIIINEDNLEK